jgi:hypothetical protein
MGSVSIDIKAKERDYYLLTLSDHNVVKYLIKHRESIDKTYPRIDNIAISIDEAGSISELNQEVIALYVSLEDTIKRCKFNDNERMIINMMFEGHTLSDIYNITKKISKQGIYKYFDKIVEKIVSKNNEMWKESMYKCGYIKHGVDKDES